MNTLLDETILLGIERAIETGFKRVGHAKFIDFDGHPVEVVCRVEKTQGCEYVYAGKGAHRVKDYHTIPVDRLIKL